MMMTVFRAILVVGLCGVLPGLVMGQVQVEGITVFGISAELAEGAEAIRSGDYRRGIRLTLLGLSAEVSPRQRAVALSNLCAAFTGDDQHEEAIRRCAAALELDPRRWQAYNNRALAYLGLGDLEAAERDVATGLSINPESTMLRRVQQLLDARRQAQHPQPAAPDTER